MNKKKSKKTQNSINKLIVPLAGFGTRFLPITKNYPREMMNLIDKPVVQYLVEEAYQSGIREVIFVLNYKKGLVSKYFSDKHNSIDKKVYESKTAQENLRELNFLLKKMKFRYVKKRVTFGDGHSIFCARHLIKKGEVFASTMGDLLSPTEKPFLKQLVSVYNKVQKPVISVQRIPKKETYKYGVISPKKSQGRLHYVTDLVEKPKVGLAPSNIAMTGKYILTHDIFLYLDKLLKKRKESDGEVRLADALKQYANDKGLYAYECVGEIQDTGNKIDFLKATLYYGLRHPIYGRTFRNYCRKYRF